MTETPTYVDFDELNPTQQEMAEAVGRGIFYFFAKKISSPAIQYDTTIKLADSALDVVVTGNIAGRFRLNSLRDEPIIDLTAAFEFHFEVQNDCEPDIVRRPPRSQVWNQHLLLSIRAADPDDSFNVADDDSHPGSLLWKFHEQVGSALEGKAIYQARLILREWERTATYRRVRAVEAACRRRFLAEALENYEGSLTASFPESDPT